jgi:hypothetical protein
MSDNSITLINKRPTVIGLVDGTHLLPRSKTVLSSATYAKVKDDPTFKAWLKMNWLAIQQGAVDFSPPDAPEQVDALKGVSVEQAKLMVTACGDVPLLEAWHGAEARKGVKKAIEARISELVSGSEPAEPTPAPADDMDEIFGGPEE